MVKPFLAPTLGELDDQNRVLGGKADQHDETDLRIDVGLQAAHEERQERTEQRQRYREQHHERHRPALILRRQDQEHEDDREREHDGGDRSRLQFLIGDAGPFECEVARQRDCSGPLHRRDRLARAVARAQRRR